MCENNRDSSLEKPLKALFDLDRSIVLTTLTVVGMMLAILALWPLKGDIAGLVSFVGLSLVYLAGGAPAGWRAGVTLWQEHILDIDLLMVVAAVAAAAVGAPFEGAVLLTLFSISTTLEERALGRARQAIEALMALRPETALRKGPDGAVLEVPAAALKVDDIVVLRPGARVPADAMIVSGRGSLDEANITGESMPVAKAPGVQIFEATVNLDGVLEARVTKTVAESTVARMIALVTEAQAPGTIRAVQRMVRAAPHHRGDGGRRLAFAVFYLLGRDWGDALYRSATLLVAASPCAIVISVPAAILSAPRSGGGVLFKGGAALETLADVDIFAFDKTGTLTTGKASVTQMVALDGDEEAFLPLLAGLEAHSGTTARRRSGRKPPGAASCLPK